MIKNMHYMFKLKLNKIDSQTFGNLLVPEIDLILNEALIYFINLNAEPRGVKSHLGFETNERSIQNLRPLVVTDEEIVPSLIIGKTNEYRVTLPATYHYHAKSWCLINNNKCQEDVKADVIIRTHNELFDKAFVSSSYDWREVNVLYDSGGIIAYTDDFSITKYYLSYIQKHPYIHNAEDWNVAGYYSEAVGGTLVGTQNCLLPIDTHNEIVDIAVLMATGNMQIPDYQLKLNQLKLNQLIN